MWQCNSVTVKSVCRSLCIIKSISKQRVCSFEHDACKESLTRLNIKKNYKEYLSCIPLEFFSFDIFNLKSLIKTHSNIMAIFLRNFINPEKNYTTHFISKLVVTSAFPSKYSMSSPVTVNTNVSIIWTAFCMVRWFTTSLVFVSNLNTRE